MSGKYDKILKEILGKSIHVFIRKILGIDAVEITPLNCKMQITNEREADFIYRIAERDDSSPSGKKPPYIMHIEIHAKNGPKIPRRMLMYWLFTDEIYDEYPKQYLFYVGKEPLTMPDHHPKLGDAYKYTIIDFSTIDCETFVNSGSPEEIVVSVLCNFKGKDGTIVLENVFSKLKDAVTDALQLSKYIRQVEVLSHLRGLEEIAAKEAKKMPLIFDATKDRLYKQGLEKGLTKGELKGERKGRLEGKLEGRLEGKLEGRLEGQLEGERKGKIEGRREGLLEGIQLALDIKYGELGLSVMDKMSVIGDLNKLERIKELIKQSVTVEELEILIDQI